MKVKYLNNSTRWEVILFDYIDDVPTSDPPKVAVYSGNRGVVGISVSRSKASIQSTASISIVGELNAAYTVGNWVIIKSKVGKFKEKSDEKSAFKDVSPLKEGIIRFIGQITTIQNSYSVDGSGLLVKRATVHIREWSSLLNIPVRIDAYSVSSYTNQTQEALGRLSFVDGNVSKVNYVQPRNIQFQKLAQQLIDPFVGAGLVLSIIGGLNTDSQTGASLGVDLGEYQKVVSMSRLTSRMPSLPQELLDYLELPKTTQTNNAFATGFTNTLLGVMYANSSFEGSKSGALDGYGKEERDPKSFNGYFNSYSQLKSMFSNYQDRPVKSNFFSSLGKGASAWSLIQEHIDTTINEAFTDIWYFKTESGATTSLPMIILRDKPFALKTFLTDPDNQIKHTKWTAFDDLPRVFVDDVMIQSVSTTNSFFTSPNFIEPQLQTGEVGSSRTDDPTTILTTAVHRIIDDGAINRFGTIEHYWNTVYSAPTAKTSESGTVYVPWFEDTKKLMYYWHALSYRFGDASLTLKDNDLPIMVGCNLSFPMGKNVLCGHVESVSWSFSIGMDGSASTTTNVQLSYLCKVKSKLEDDKDAGGLTLIGPAGFTDLTDPELADSNIRETFKFPEFKTEIPKTQELLPKLNLPKLPKAPF
jgi:hypothetical protein